MTWVSRTPQESVRIVQPTPPLLSRFLENRKHWDVRWLHGKMHLDSVIFVVFGLFGEMELFRNSNSAKIFTYNISDQHLSSLGCALSSRCPKTSLWILKDSPRQVQIFNISSQRFVFSLCFLALFSRLFDSSTSPWLATHEEKVRFSPYESTVPPIGAIGSNSTST